MCFVSHPYLLIIYLFPFFSCRSCSLVHFFYLNSLSTYHLPYAISLWFLIDMDKEREKRKHFKLTQLARYYSRCFTFLQQFNLHSKHIKLRVLGCIYTIHACTDQNTDSKI